jgi:hypothetical protein
MVPRLARSGPPERPGINARCLGMGSVVFTISHPPGLAAVSETRGVRIRFDSASDSTPKTAISSGGAIPCGCPYKNPTENDLQNSAECAGCAVPQIPKGTGIIKTAKLTGLGTGTVHRMTRSSPALMIKSSPKGADPRPDPGAYPFAGSGNGHAVVCCNMCRRNLRLGVVASGRSRTSGFAGEGSANPNPPLEYGKPALCRWISR